MFKNNKRKASNSFIVEDIKDINLCLNYGFEFIEIIICSELISNQNINYIDTNFNNCYLQACCMVFNKNCLDFFKEVLQHYQNFNSDVYPYGDESIINCIIWRDKLSNNLGNVFLCSHYFSPYLIEGFIKSKDSEEYKRLFDISLRCDGVDEDGFILSHGFSLARHNRIGLINNNFENLLFLHGSKRLDIHNKYLSLMK